MAEDRKLFRFGIFEADTASGELRKSGMRLKLQEQPFQVLLLFLERPGELVTRDELRQRLWPADTFVDFDHSLNTIVNKLREALGDSAASPRFIETLAKRGYRFLARVEVVSNGKAVEVVPQIAPPAPGKANGSLLTQLEDLPSARPGYVRILILLIQFLYLSFYITALARLSAIEDLLERSFGHPDWVVAILVVTAVIGIPLRLYLLAAVSFDVKGLAQRFLRLFPAVFPLDELWALVPLLLVPQIGIGLALAATAALIYLPFSQRTLLMMREPG